MKAEEAGFVEVSDAVVIVAATLDSLSFVEQSENNHKLIDVGLSTMIYFIIVDTTRKHNNVDGYKRNVFYELMKSW